MNPPEELNPTARQIWAETRDELTAAGRTPNPGTLLAFAEACDIHAQATVQVNDGTIVIQEDGRNAYRNPAIALVNRQAELIIQLADQLGLNRRTLKPITPTVEPAPIIRGRWCDEHNRYECTAQRTRGRGDCHHIAALGIGKCQMHAGVKLGESVAHILALEQRQNPLAGEPLDMGPAEVFKWRIGHYAGEVSRLDDLVASLEAEDLIYGQTEDITEEGPDGDARKVKRQARIHMYQVLRDSREKLLLSTCEAALKAGVDERLVQIAELEAVKIHDAFATGLRRLGIHDDPRVPVVMSQVLRELTA